MVSLFPHASGIEYGDAKCDDGEKQKRYNTVSYSHAVKVKKEKVKGSDHHRCDSQPAVFDVSDQQAEDKEYQGGKCPG